MISNSVDLGRTLLESPFTVTHLLEELTGERLEADVVRRCSAPASTDNDLGVPVGSEVMHRNAILKGHDTGRPYLYAESTFVAERLPKPVQVQLEETNDPIGRILVAHDLRLERRSLSHGTPSGAAVPVFLTEPAADIAWSRAYLLLIDQLPVFAIREWFMGWVIDALERQVSA